MKIGRRSIGGMTLIVGFVAALSWSQTSTTSLRGTIVDPKGAVIPGADVALANPSIGFSRATKTDDQGFYQFLEVPPTTYTLTIKAPGFGALQLDNVRLLVNTPSTLNQTLHVQKVTESIEVESSHCGMGHHPAVVYAVADRLAQPEGAWRPFDRSGWRGFVYPDPNR